MQDSKEETSDLTAVLAGGAHAILCLCPGFSAVLPDLQFLTWSQEICGVLDGSLAVRLDPVRSILRKEDLDPIFERIAYAPSQGQKHFFLIEEAHRLNIYAANALLKILEEPPSSCLFILTCTKEHSRLLPATVRSRLHTMRLKFPVSEDSVLTLSQECLDLLKELISIKQKNLTHLKNILAYSQKWASEYPASLWQDALVETVVFLRRSQDTEEIRQKTMHVLQSVRIWKDQEAFHPNTSYWLVRILHGSST